MQQYSAQTSRVMSPQVRQFKPKLVALRDGSKADELRERLKGGEVPEIVIGDAGAVECAVHPDADAVVTGEP